MAELIYEPIPELADSEIAATIKRNDSNELRTIPLSAALHLHNRELAEEICMNLAAHDNPFVRGNSLLGFGHIARIDGRLNELQVKDLIAEGLADSDEFVRGQAASAKEDIEWFLGWTFEG